MALLLGRSTEGLEREVGDIGWMSAFISYGGSKEVVAEAGGTGLQQMSP